MAKIVASRMARLLDFEPYVNDSEHFTSYVERFDHYWKMTQDKDDSLKKSAFITAIGKRTYKTLKDLLLAAAKPEQIYDKIIKVPKEHYTPGSKAPLPSAIAHCR